MTSETQAKKLAYPLAPRADMEEMFKKEINAKYVLDEVALTEFKPVSLSNIRPDTVSVDEARRDHYAAMMEEGMLFPPVIATLNGDRQLEILGGAHREAAAKKIGATHIPAYVFPVLTDRQSLDLRVLDNRGHGMELSKSEKLTLADQLIDISGYTIPEASNRVGLGIHVVRRHRKIAESTQRAREEGGVSRRQTGKVSQATLLELNRIKNKKAYQATVKLAVDKGMKARQASDLVQAVNAQGSEAEKLELLKREAEAIYEIETTHREEYTKLARVLTSLETIDFPVARRQARSEELPILAGRIQTGLDHLKVWLEDLEEGNTE